MGFYKVKCKKCDEQWEVMVPYTDLEGMVCGGTDYYGRPVQWRDTEDGSIENTEGCGNLVERIVELKPFAIAGSSLDTHGVDNVNGYWSPSFGRYFKNKHACYAHAEANGYRPVSQKEADDALGGQYNNLQKQDKVGQTYSENLKKAKGDKVEAAAKTFVPANMQDK